MKVDLAQTQVRLSHDMYGYAWDHTKMDMDRHCCVEANPNASGRP